MRLPQATGDDSSPSDFLRKFTLEAQSWRAGPTFSSFVSFPTESVCSSRGLFLLSTYQKLCLSCSFTFSVSRVQKAFVDNPPITNEPSYPAWPPVEPLWAWGSQRPGCMEHKPTAATADRPQSLGLSSRGPFTQIRKYPVGLCTSPPNQTPEVFFLLKNLWRKCFPEIKLNSKPGIYFEARIQDSEGRIGSLLNHVSTGPFKCCAAQVMLVVKNPPGNAGDIRAPGLIPELGRSPGEGLGNPPSYSFLENPMDRGAWWAMIHRVEKSRTWLKWLSTNATAIWGL